MVKSKAKQVKNKKAAVKKQQEPDRPLTKKERKERKLRSQRIHRMYAAAPDMLALLKEMHEEIISMDGVLMFHRKCGRLIAKIEGHRPQGFGFGSIWQEIENRQDIQQDDQESVMVLSA